MAESITKRNARLRAMRRKYGLGEFKKSGSRAPRRRRSSAPMARKRKSRSRSSFLGGGAGINLKDVLFSAGYGFVRNDIRSAAAPLIAMVPAGDYADNLTLAGAAYVASKFISSPLVKQAAKTIVLNEAFLAGAKARMGGSISLTAGTSSSNAASWT